jgi:putative ABC transport system ATP-binding protein
VTAVLELSALSVRAGGATLVDGLDLRLGPGDRVALVGPSGSGKTSLLRAIALLDDPAAGQLRLRGRTPEEWGYPTWRRRVGYVAQRPSLFDATVDLCLRRPFSYSTAGAPFPEERAHAVLVGLGLAGARDRDPSTLSEGEKQRVAIARALLVGNDVLLLDEPTSALDHAATAATERLLLEETTTRSRALLWVTHDLLQAERTCTRRVDLGGGRAVEDPAHAANGTALPRSTTTEET